MSPSAQQPQMNLAQTPDYRESYANSVQIRVSVWDFQLVFGLASSDSPDQITIRNHNAVFLSPQQSTWSDRRRCAVRGLSCEFRRTHSSEPQAERNLS